jgi:hypothetical protein
VVSKSDSPKQTGSGQRQPHFVVDLPERFLAGALLNEIDWSTVYASGPRFMHQDQMGTTIIQRFVT